ncbi:topoisomerase C-terminal repeat-containing protein, partial [Escherichia coli]
VSKTALERLSVNCPNCNAQLVVTPKTYSCTGCKFKIWIECRGKKLTIKQVEILISKGKSGEIKGFKSKKDNSTYSMILTLKDKTTGELGFEYSPRVI